MTVDTVHLQLVFTVYAIPRLVLAMQGATRPRRVFASLGILALVLLQIDGVLTVLAGLT